MALVAGLKRGDLIADKYKVERVIGRGGMSVVLEAVHIGLDEPVAIKVLLPDAIENDVVLARFQREARATAKIKSEHVTRVLDVGTISGDTPYIIMERLQGEDLGARLKRAGPIAVEIACRYVLQACEALAEAHSIGIVHRDLKPDNLFVTRRGASEVVKVLDFGISKAMAPEQAAMTRTSTIIGSPLYMSPEQLRTPREVDHLTDIWTLGVVLYELTTGRPPFVAKNLRELAFAIVGDPPKPMQPLVSVLPAGFEALVQRCLAKERGSRYQTIAELTQALAAFSPTQGRISAERTGVLLPVAPTSAGRPRQQTETGTVRLTGDEDPDQIRLAPPAPMPVPTDDEARTVLVPTGSADAFDDDQATVLIDAKGLMPATRPSSPEPSFAPPSGATTDATTIPHSTATRPSAPGPAPNRSTLETLPVAGRVDEARSSAPDSLLDGIRPSQPDPLLEGMRPSQPDPLLDGMRPSQPDSARPGPSPWSSQVDDDDANTTLPAPPSGQNNTRRRNLWLVAALGLLLAGGIAYALTRMQGPVVTPPETPPSTAEPSNPAAPEAP